MKNAAFTQTMSFYTQRMSMNIHFKALGKSIRIWSQLWWKIKVKKNENMVDLFFIDKNIDIDRKNEKIFIKGKRNWSK